MKYPRLLLILLPVLLVSCSSVRYEHSFNPSVDPAGYERFGLLPIPHPEYDTQAYAILGMYDFSQVIVRSVLESKGYQYVEDDSAEFYVGIRAATGVPELPKVETASMQWAGDFAFSFERISGSLGDPFPGYEAPVNNSDRVQSQGALLDHIAHGQPSGYYVIVEVFDSASRSRIWTGWARAHTEIAYRNDEKRAEVIAKMVGAFGN